MSDVSEVTIASESSSGSSEASSSIRDSQQSSTSSSSEVNPSESDAGNEAVDSENRSEPAGCQENDVQPGFGVRPLNHNETSETGEGALVMSRSNISAERDDAKQRTEQWAQQEQFRRQRQTPYTKTQERGEPNADFLSDYDNISRHDSRQRYRQGNEESMSQSSRGQRRREARRETRPLAEQTMRHIPSSIVLAVKPLEHADWTSLRGEWKTWKYALTVAMNTQPFAETAKMALLVSRGGPLIQELAMDGPAVPEEERVGARDEPVYSNLMKRIEARIAQAASSNFDMARLNEATQRDGEAIEAFAKRLRDLAKLCNLEEKSSELLIRNRLFEGSRHGARLQEMAMPNPSMDSNQIARMGTRIEERDRATKMKKFSGESSAAKLAEPMAEREETNTVAAIGRGRGGVASRSNEAYNSKNVNREAPTRERSPFYRDGYREANNQGRYDRSYESRPYAGNGSANQRFHERPRQNFRPYTTPSQHRPTATDYRCRRCGYDCRLQRQCPAEGQKCRECQGVGHFGSMCYSRNRGSSGGNDFPERRQQSNEQHNDKRIHNVSRRSRAEPNKVEKHDSGDESEQ